jgi:SAM-dependent methyltransferase
LSPAEEERQAAWYAAHRRQLYRELGLRRGRILEVGCGGGVITRELAEGHASLVAGLDRRPEVLHPRAGVRFVAAAAERLPFRDAVWDAVVTAFSLVWLADARAFLANAVRIMKDDAWFVALAEPDYEGLIEYPAETSSAAEGAPAVRNWGGDPALGRKLPALIAGAGLELVRLGSLNALWTPGRWAEEEDQEAELLARLVGGWTLPERLRDLRIARKNAVASGERFYFLPIFYAAARKRK